MVEELKNLQYKQDDDGTYPLFVYIYDSDGNYRTPLRVANQADLESAFFTLVALAVEEGREVRITDTGDLLCFHSKDGKIVWDGEKLCE